MSVCESEYESEKLSRNWVLICAVMRDQGDIAIQGVALVVLLFRELLESVRKLGRSITAPILAPFAVLKYVLHVAYASSTCSWRLSTFLLFC